MEENNLYYPINLNLQNLTCLVIGGGKVAARKIKTLLKYKAKVKVISPKILSELEKLNKEKKIKIILRKFKSLDLKNAFLVIGATNSSALNEKIYLLAKKKNILVNIVDNPKYCNFIVPSILKRGALNIGISTSGLSPALAKKLRMELEKILPKSLNQTLEKISRIRKKIKKLPKKEKEKFWKKFLNFSILKSKT